MTQPQRHRTGFTLIELIVAMAIFAVMSIFSYQGLRNFLTARAAIEDHDETFLRIAKGFSLLQQDAEGAVARPIRDELGDPLPALEGSRDTDVLLALTRHTAWAPLAEQSADLKRVEYRLEQGNLMRRTWEVLDRLPDSKYQDRVLLEQVADVAIRYFTQDEWVEVWPPTRGSGTLAQLPRALSFEVIFANGRAIKRVFLLPGTG